MAIDNGIPLITDIKCAKLFIEVKWHSNMFISFVVDNIHFQALRIIKGRPPMNTQIDCISSRKLLRLPGFIDVHVHMREPGATHKETWETGK